MAVVIVGSALFGYVFQRLAYYPLRDRPTIHVVISCLGAGIFMKNAMQAIAGPEPLTMKPFFARESVHVADLQIPTQSVVIIVVTIVLFAFQYWFFFGTALGRKLRATANDKYAARLSGIRVRRMIALAFIISCILAGIAGFILVPIFLASPNMGFGLVVKAWIGVVIGGFGSVPGAIVGGIIVGMLETFTASYISSAYKDVITMLVLLAVLFLRPQGIFSESVQEKV
jgi:branched-chain amino acid transport system permease protein